ncbi:hypothetical protein L3Q82_025399, partial [Scortum barcoo]
MTAIYPKFTKLASIFLDPNYKRFSKICDYLPPFGVKSQEKIIDILLSATKNYGLGEELDSLSCKTCIIIGNGGILTNKSLGQKIDEFDVVVRLNEAPVKGFEKDVGSKTTIRITYPEGAIQKTERYETESLFVLSAFKALDFKWLRHMVFSQRLRSTDGFWKSVARHVPREPSDMRILNPYFIQEASFKLIGLPHNNGQMGRGNIPTLGTVAITMALHNCDEVAVAGFGYNMSTPHAPLHYYEKIRMSAIKESWTHNISKEKEFLIKLVKAGVIQDWTNGIYEKIWWRQEASTAQHHLKNWKVMLWVVATLLTLMEDVFSEEDNKDAQSDLQHALRQPSWSPADNMEQDSSIHTSWSEAIG